MEHSVSLIIPNYNRGDLIGETLKSVQSQTFKFWECLIIDDGSTDNSLEIINEYQKNDLRFRLIKREREPKGAPTCRNIGIKEAQGEFIVFLDSDDMLAFFCLEKRVSLFEKNPNKDFLVFNSRLFDSVPYDTTLVWNIENELPDILRFLSIDALWCISGPIYKKEFLERLGGFNEKLSFWQDFELHVRSIILRSDYLKFLHLPSDVHIRVGRSDTLSRSIQFTENNYILSERIEIYFSFLNLVEKSNLKNDTRVMHTLYSMMFFLISQSFLKHNNLIRFLSKWKEVKLKLKLGGVPYFSGILYCLILKLSNKIKLLRGKVQRLEKFHFLNLPSYSIMSNNTMQKMNENSHLPH